VEIAKLLVLHKLSSYKMYNSILHASLIIKDTKNSLMFYHDILGLSIDDDRPDLGFPGAWLNIGAQQIHLLELPNPDPVDNRPTHGGRDRHVAIGLSDIDQLMLILKTHDITFTTSSSGRKALFCRDPDGNTLEFIQKN